MPSVLAPSVQQWAPAEASPSGLVHIGGTLFIANLRGQVLRAVPVTEPSTSESYFDGEFGRIRDAAEAPDGTLWFVTNNTDGRGTPGPDDDRILSVKAERKCRLSWECADGGPAGTSLKRGSLALVKSGPLESAEGNFDIR